MSTTTTFDLGRFTRAAEERDASAQLLMYAPNATVTVADQLTPPGAPRVLHGHEAIRTWLDDLYARDMTHAVGHRVGDEAGAAFTLACRYPTGARVLCATVLELEDGRIADQIVVQAWDEVS